MMRVVVCTAVAKQRQMFKSAVTNVVDTFVDSVTGAMNFKRITKFASVIDVMPFTAEGVTKWINVMIVVKSFVPLAVRYCRVNSVGEDCVKSVQQRVDGT